MFFPKWEKNHIDQHKWKDPLTGITSVINQLSPLSVSKDCADFPAELNICSTKLGVPVRFTPKYHPEITRAGIEYCWGYSKFRFWSEFNCGNLNVETLQKNVEKSLDQSVIAKNWISKLARKARECKLTHSFLVSLCRNDDNGVSEQVKKTEIEHMTKVFKAHRFIVNCWLGGWCDFRHTTQSHTQCSATKKFFYSSLTLQ